MTGHLPHLTAVACFFQDKLLADFAKFDTNTDNQLSLEEFLQAYAGGAIADVFCVSTAELQDQPHHPSVIGLGLPAASMADLVLRRECHFWQLHTGRYIGRSTSGTHW